MKLVKITHKEFLMLPLHTKYYWSDDTSDYLVKLGPNSHYSKPMSGTYRMVQASIIYKFRCKLREIL